MDVSRGLQTLRRAACISRPAFPPVSPAVFLAVFPAVVSSPPVYRPISTQPRLQAPLPPPAAAEAVASNHPSSASSTPLYSSQPLSAAAFFDRDSAHRLRAQLGVTPRFPVAKGKPKVLPENLWKTKGPENLWETERKTSTIDNIVRKTADESMTSPNPTPFNYRRLLRFTPEYEMRMRPSTGRMVEVKGAVDAGRSFALLERQIKQNRVRNDVTQQRFHERPGKKRKRLKSQRWIMRFRKGFNATCDRVSDLSRQGW